MTGEIIYCKKSAQPRFDGDVDYYKILPSVNKYYYLIFGHWVISANPATVALDMLSNGDLIKVEESDIFLEIL